MTNNSQTISVQRRAFPGWWGRGEFEYMRIFLIEDEDLLAETATDTLTDAGFTVVGVAGDAPAAIERVLELKPDMLLVDLQLRGATTGAMAIEGIRAHLQIPALFLSSSTAECRKLGRKYTYGCLSKPYSANQLVAAVRAVANLAAGEPLGSLPVNLEIYEPESA